MVTKILLVLLGATLAFADLESDYIEVSRQKDEQLVLNYFLTRDPLASRLQFDQWWARIAYISVLGKQKALELADISHVEEVKKDWAVIDELVLNLLGESKQIVDSLRSQALVKAPIEWSQVTQVIIKMLEDWKRAATEGNLNEMKKVAYQYINYLRTDVNVNLRAVIESR